MAELKTKENSKNVLEFIESLNDEQKKKDSLELLALMKEVTGSEPKMWGDSIIGFGNYHYKYASGREGDWFLTGFSPRKQNMTIYLMCELEKQPGLSEELGKFKIGKSCLYFKQLGDLNTEVLKKLILESTKSKEAKKSV
jgi:hypothetical protein